MILLLLYLIVLLGCATATPAPSKPAPRICTRPEITERTREFCRPHGAAVGTITLDDGTGALLLCADQTTGLLRCIDADTPPAVLDRVTTLPPSKDAS